MHREKWERMAILAVCLGWGVAEAQIDTTKRDLIEGGYNFPFEGKSPLSGYGYYYRNQPNFLQTNLTLRLAIGPTYADSELGIAQALGPQTDLGLNLSGGGYRDDYDEIRVGHYYREESFEGFRGQAGFGIYHLFNPGAKVPLYGVVQTSARFVSYSESTYTATNFVEPKHRGIFTVRTGLRYGGRPPVLFPSQAMELSVWYEGYIRTDPETYGFDGDRKINAHTHLFWANAHLAYHLTKWKHPFSVNFTGGTSVDADRLSAWRLGGVLPPASEYPLWIPGYYYQEISAKNFFQAGGNYTIPLTENKRWNLHAMAATAYVSYLPGFEQQGHWNSGVGGGLYYNSKVWRVLMDYGYGIDAIRTSGRGAHSVIILLQMDLAPAKEAYYSAEPPGFWRGLRRVVTD